MLNYIIEVYFIRIVSSAVIHLQRSPPYTGCLPRNDHLLWRVTPLHRTPTHEPPLSYNSHPLTMTQQLKRVPTATRLIFRQGTVLKNICCWEPCQLYITKEWVKFLQYLIKGRYEKWFNFCSLLVQSRLGCFSQASLFVCLLVCFVLSCFVLFFLIYSFSL